MAEAKNIVLVVHYYPPINSSGAKRMEAMSKYFARWGRNVTVIAPRKGPIDGAFTEHVPDGVHLIELDHFGRFSPTQVDEMASGGQGFGPPQTGWFRSLKNFVMRQMGQLPDPRLPFALSFGGPTLAKEAREALANADVVVGTCPPWPPLLAVLFAKKRYGVPAILDYRDQLSMCHEMPGGKLAKKVEVILDRWLTRRADMIVAISEPMRDYYADFHSDVIAILNGYDHEKLAEARRERPWRPRDSGQPAVIRYAGIITPGRIPRAMLTALSRLHARGADLRSMTRFEYVGECDLLRQFIAEHHPELQDLFHFLPRVSYAESLHRIVSADFLLFCENGVSSREGHEASASGILTTKLFEYLASERPIIAEISAESLAGSFIIKASHDHFVATQAEQFERFFLSPDFQNPPVPEVGDFVLSLSREMQARQYLEAIDQVYGKTGGHENARSQ